MINYIFRMSLFFIQSKLFIEINFKMLDKKSRIKVLVHLSFLLVPFLIFSITSQIYTNQEEPDYNGDVVKNPKKSGYWIVSPIIIDGNSGWETASSTYDWITGSGTWIDPYIIENVRIDGGYSDSCILIRNSNVYFIIRNVTVYHSGAGSQDAGIVLNSVNKGTLTNNSFSDNYNGVYIVYGNNNTLSENIVSNNIKNGIYLDSSNNNTVSGNTANINRDYGIRMNLGDNNTISGNTANNNGYYGIYISDYSGYNTIEGNTANNNSDHGIYLWGSHNTIVSGNTANNNSDHGIYLLHSDSNNIVSENTANNNGDYGIELHYSDNNVVLRNDAHNNRAGIMLYDSNENEILRNTCSNNWEGGILVYSDSAS
ncbi:hypothetical protein LCGC14_2412700, partial [marine sediment metagenome]